MKKFLFLIPAFLLAFQISKAQTEKGTQTVGANLNFNTQKSNIVNIDPSTGLSTQSKNKYTNLGIGPNYSYFIADKLDIGANLTYSHYMSADENSSYPTSQHQNMYDAQIFIRKYLMYNDKFGLRAGPYLEYSRGNYNYTYDYPNAGPNPTQSKTESYGAGANLGLVYYPSKCIGLSAALAGIYYSHSTTNNGANGHSSGDGFGASFISNNFGLSLFYVFGGK